MTSFSSKYVRSSNGDYNPLLKQRGYAITSEYGGPLDTAEWSLTYPGNDWPNIYPGKLVYVFDEDEYYYADSALIWHPIGDLVGEDIGNDDVYFDIDFTVTGASKDSKYGHTWVFNHGDSVNITQNIAILIGGKSVRIEGMNILTPPRLSDFPINSEIRNDAPFIPVDDYEYRANNTNKVVRSGVIPCEVMTESGLHITGRLKYAINPEGSTDTYEKFIQDVSSRMLYLHPDTHELQKGFLIASESGGALDVTGYTGMPDEDFTDYNKGLRPWYNGQELTNMYLGKRVYNYDPQSPEKSALYRYSYNAGNYMEEGVLKHGIRFDVNFYEFGKGIEHNERIINWEYHNPYLLDMQKNDDGTTRRSGSLPEKFIAPNWVKFKKNDNNRGKIKDYCIKFSFDEKSGYACINLSNWGVYDSSVLKYYKWSAYNTGHGSSIGCKLPGPADSFSERRFVTASLTAQLQTPGSSTWQTQILIQDESRFLWDASMRFAADDPVHKSEWSPSDPSTASTGLTFPSNSAANGSWNYWLENMTFLRKYIDLTLSLDSDIPGVSSLSYVKNTVLNIEVEPMFASSMIQMSSTSNFSTTPSQLYFGGTREHSIQKVWFRIVPRLKEDNTVYAAIASDVESEMTAEVETPADLASVSLSKEGVNLYSVPVDTYNLTGTSANWKIYVTGRFKDDITGIPGGELVNTQFTVTVSAKPVNLKIRFFSDQALTSEVFGIARRGNENIASTVYATLWDGQVRLKDDIRMMSFNLVGTAAQVLEYTIKPSDSDSYCDNGILWIRVVPKNTVITNDKSGEITATLADVSGEATGSLPVTVTTVNYTMKFRMFSSPNLTEETAVTDWISKNEMLNLISDIPQYPDPAVRSGYSKWNNKKAVYIVARVENDENSSDVSSILGPGGSQYWMLTINDKHRSPLTNLSSDAIFSIHSSYYHKEETLTAKWKSYTPVWQAWILPELQAGANVAQTEFVIKFRDQNDTDSEWKRADESKSVKFRDYNGDVDDAAEFKVSFIWEKSGHSSFNIQTADADTTKVLSMPDADSEEEFTLKLGCTAMLRHVTDTNEIYRETAYDDTVYGHKPAAKAHPEQIFPTQGFYTWIDQRNANILFFPADGYTDGDGDWTSASAPGGNFEICMTVKGYNLDLADENAIKEWFNAGIWDDWNFNGVTERTGSTVVIVKFTTKSAIGNSKSWTFSLKDSSDSSNSSTVYATAVRPQRPSIWTPWIFLDGNQKWKNNDGKMRTQSDSLYYDDGYRFVFCDWHHEMRMDVSINRTDETGFAKWRVTSGNTTLDSVYKYLTVEATCDYAPDGVWTPSLDSAKGTFSQVGSRYMLENQPEFKCMLPDRGLQSGWSNTLYVKSIVIDWRYWLITLTPFDDVTNTAWSENKFSINTDYKWGIHSFNDTPKVKEYWNEGQQSKAKDVKLRPTSTTSRDGIDRNWWIGDVKLTGNRFSAPNEYREFTLDLVPVISGLPEQPRLSTIFKKDCQNNEYYRVWLAHPLCFNVVEGHNINWLISPGVQSTYFLSQSSSDPDYEYPVVRDETTPRSEARLSTLPYGYLSVSISNSVEPSVTSVTYSIKSCSNPEIEFDTTNSQPHNISNKLRSYHDVSILTGWCDAAYRSSYCADESGHEIAEYWYRRYPGPLGSPYIRGSVEFTSDWVQVDITIDLGTMAVPVWAKASSTPTEPYCTLREVDGTKVDLPVTPYHGLIGQTTRTGHAAPLGSLGDADMTWTYPYAGTDSSYYSAAYSKPIDNYTGKAVLNGAQFRGSGYKIVERTAPQVSDKNITLSYLVKPNVCVPVNPNIPGFTQLLKTADETWIFEINLGAGKTIHASLDVPIYMKQFGGAKFEVDSANAEEYNIGSSITLLTKVAVADDLDRARDYVEADFKDDGIHPQIPRHWSDYSNNANDKVPSGGYMTIEFIVDNGNDKYDGDPESNRNADSHAEARSSWSNTNNSTNAYKTWKRRFTISKYLGSYDSINSGSHEIQMIAKIYDAAGNLQSVARVYQSFSATMSNWNNDGDNDGIPADLKLVTASFGTK